VGGGLAEMRSLVRETQPLRHHEPLGDRAAWDRAAARIAGGGNGKG
jgi:rhamnulokinase